VAELQELSSAFDVMRRTLANRLEQLNTANTRLADQNAKLTALQSELLQRDRLQTTARLLAQLAHEIRNPVANVRNCLEIIRRRTTTDDKTHEFADLAIDELLRMHELAEQMLDVNRPRDPLSRSCSPVAVARDVVRLAMVGAAPGDLSVDVSGDENLTAAIAPDALKQVLANLVQNAREAVAQDGNSSQAKISIVVRQSEHGVGIDVRDNGPGLSADIRPRIFDAFFTTKESMNGVGLGLYVAGGLVQSAGGRISAEEVAGRGALFRVELAAATDAVGRNAALGHQEQLARPV
jgi:two-component system NtrC family sensor kinase